MFYEELYTELGKLFYHIAAADGKVRPAERESLEKLIHETWQPVESSKDEFGTDQAELIGFAFDYEEAEAYEDNGFESFRQFYKDNSKRFTPQIADKILETAKAIASTYRGQNKDEKKEIEKLKKLFGK
jgi:hypothetical protein